MFRALQSRSVLPYALLLAAATAAAPALAQSAPLKVFISVDMEGIGGIGTGAMTNSNGGKDYATGRSLMTAEVNTVVEAIFSQGEAQILVNDSHGDMQNLLHTELDPRVEYIQGSIKPLGMVQGLDESFDAVIFLGYHARAGTTDGFLAHTGTGSVEALWINGTEVGEGGLNAYAAGALGVPVLVAAGDSAFVAEITALVPGVHAVRTKTAIGASVARLVHPDVVRQQLREATRAGLASLGSARTVVPRTPVTARIRFDSTQQADILMAVPGMRRVDGYTVEAEAPTMERAYALIRLMYRFVRG
ncbi:MAG: M55 family metallopeptidase [Gemmatimonadota bacterium]